ncbi:ABC transporter permease [Vulcanisaeta distributa]|uniref:Binding-protein-dependent transport systems inner membrane component n=1 Tax=Vulcanisaeta distributa (strain DSM 14429 / JCM 11212 / NBRC 100878 / IC-017) TaxID=572478 RepID=E1QSH4_VULDI|nr:ABC transporter permease [Vulcanisaeta distributa]ADN50767.1 binding-protein-dependent transport systems inner membrane component [Vulcanisaeta distributa DSM 14429]
MATQITVTTERRVSSLRLFMTYMIHNPPTLVGFIITVAFYGWAIIEGVLQLLGTLLHNPAIGWALLPYNPFAVNYAAAFQPPSLKHIFGTDNLGRDLFSEILYGTPTEALISILVVGSAIIIGGLIGMVSGYFGKYVDEAGMRVTDMFLAFPAIILALAVEAAIGRGAVNAAIALVVVWWPTYARLFRAETLRVKTQYFIDAAKLSGTSTIGIIFRHIFPNVLTPVISYATIDLGNVVLAYSIISFLGFGVPPPYPEWGRLVSEGFQYFPAPAWWYAIIPGVVITIVVIGLALLGDGISEYITSGGATV